MSTWVWILVAPFVVLVAVFGLVVVVALVRARPDDVPVVLRDCTVVFGRLADRLPRQRSLSHNQGEEGDTGE